MLAVLLGGFVNLGAACADTGVDRLHDHVDHHARLLGIADGVGRAAAFGHVGVDGVAVPHAGVNQLLHVRVALRRAGAAVQHLQHVAGAVHAERLAVVGLIGLAVLVDGRHGQAGHLRGQFGAEVLRDLIEPLGHQHGGGLLATAGILHRLFDIATGQRLSGPVGRALQQVLVALALHGGVAHFGRGVLQAFVQRLDLLGRVARVAGAGDDGFGLALGAGAVAVTGQAGQRGV